MEQMRIILSLMILGIAVITDRKQAKIYNWLILAGLATGALLCLVTCIDVPGGWYITSDAGVRLKQMCFGILIPFVMLWIPFRMHGIGAGDVKLFLVLGCLNGGADVFHCICISFLLAAGISLGRLLSHRQLVNSLSLCISYLRQILLQQKIIPWIGPKDSFHILRMAEVIAAGYVLDLGVHICRNLL